MMSLLSTPTMVLVLCGRKRRGRVHIGFSVSIVIVMFVSIACTDVAYALNSFVRVAVIYVLIAA